MLYAVQSNMTKLILYWLNSARFAKHAFLFFIYCRNLWLCQEIGNYQTIILHIRWQLKWNTKYCTHFIHKYNWRNATAHMSDDVVGDSKVGDAPLVVVLTKNGRSAVGSKLCVPDLINNMIDSCT